MSTRGQKLREFVNRQQGEFTVTLFLVAGIILWITAIAFPQAAYGSHGFLGTLFTIVSLLVFFLM